MLLAAVGDQYFGCSGCPEDTDPRLEPYSPLKNWAVTLTV